MQPESYAPLRHYYFPAAESSFPAYTDFNKTFFGELSYGEQQQQQQLLSTTTTTSTTTFPDHIDSLMVGPAGPAAAAGGFSMTDSYCTSSSSPSLLNDLCRQRGGQAATTTSGSGAATISYTDEKAMLALRNHKEAEKRRRERINSHLDRLRSLLPCTTKTDKATLLAQVVQRVRELNKEATEVINKNSRDNPNQECLTIPSQNDEYSVDHETPYFNDDQNLILRASLCCEDRSDLFTDLMEMVNSLNLKTIRAEMLSLGGRATNVLVLSGERCRGEEYVAFLQDALKRIVQRSAHGGDRSKRRRRLDVVQNMG